MNHVGEKNCLACDSISTAATTLTTEACQETFKIQCGLLYCDSEKVLYLLKPKPNFDIVLIIVEVSIERLERVIGNYYCLS